MTSLRLVPFGNGTLSRRVATPIACLASALLLVTAAAAEGRRAPHGDHHSFVGDLSYDETNDDAHQYDPSGDDYETEASYQAEASYQDEYGDQDEYDYRDEHAEFADYEYGYGDGEYGYGDEIDQVGFFCGSKGQCDGCGAPPACCCCIPWWAHRCGAFGEFLLLRPGNTDIIYAIEQDSVLPNDDPTGPVGRVNVDEESGFRVGFTYALNYCSSLVTTYTNFSGNTEHFIQAENGNVLFSPIIHPSEVNVGSASGTARAAMGIDFELLDLVYRNKWKACNTYAINWLAGVRFGNMEQDFIAYQEMPIATGDTTVTTDVNFNGFGLMLGLDGIKRSCHTGFFAYGSGMASFLAGDWKGRYRQVNNIIGGGGGIIGNDYEDYRVTPVVELELGLGWSSRCQRWNFYAGYVTSAWYDAVSTRDYIEAVRFADFTDVQERITFSGLTAGMEFRY